MLKSLTVNNFTLLPNQEYQFSKQLNVIVGENGAGKTHLLKLLYALISANLALGDRPRGEVPTKKYLQHAYADKLVGVFRPETLGRLVKRVQGRKNCEVTVKHPNSNWNCQISFSNLAEDEVAVQSYPSSWRSEIPLYLPTRELLTIYPNFVSTYENYALNFESTWRDTCLLLGRAQLLGARKAKAAKLLKPIENALGGRIVLRNGRFYLNNVEMPLISEGHRKLAMLAQLIANGTIAKQSYIFWDEPEANLNPKLIKLVASVIHDLCLFGVQIFIATHSYFLLKELEMLNSQGHTQTSARDTKFFAFYRDTNLINSEDNNSIACEQATSLIQLENVVSLEEEAAQYDRELDISAHIPLPLKEIRVGT